MNFLDDKLKHSERTMTQTIVFIVGLMLLIFLLVTFEVDDSIRWRELLIVLLVYVAWLITLILIGQAKK